jgi:hypothetical protein
MARVSRSDCLYVIRELPRMYTHNLLALELRHRQVQLRSLHVPLDETGLCKGHALVRFAEGAAAHGLRAIQGADFLLAPAALPMTIAPVDASRAPGQPRTFQYKCAPASREPSPEPAVLQETQLNAQTTDQKAQAEPIAEPEAAPASSLNVDAPVFVPRAPAAAAPEVQNVAQGYLLPAPAKLRGSNDEAGSWACKDANGTVIDGAAFTALDSVNVAEEAIDVSAAVWQKYAALLQSVPAEEWSPALLANFCPEELRQMYAQASKFRAQEAPLRERPALGAQFHGLGIHLDEQKQGGCGVRTPPTRSTSCSSNGSRRPLVERQFVLPEFACAPALVGA